MHFVVTLDLLLSFELYRPSLLANLIYFLFFRVSYFRATYKKLAHITIIDEILLKMKNTY